MLRSRNQNHKIQSGLTLAALALTAAACPAQAQFNTFNPLFPTAPRISPPLGGGVLGTLAFPTFANQFAANPFPNAGPVSPFGGFAPVFLGNSGNFNNVPRNIVFSGDGSGLPLTQQGIVGSNQLITDPLSGFQQPRMIVDPISSGLVTPFGTVGRTTMPINSSLFFQSNPGLSPFVVNGSINGVTGFNTFNTLNPTVTTITPFNSFNTLNTGLGSTGVQLGARMLTTQAFVNNQANARPARVFRPAPPYNPTIPNPPASPYLPTAQQYIAAQRSVVMNNINTMPPVNSGRMVAQSGLGFNGIAQNNINTMPPISSGRMVIQQPVGMNMSGVVLNNINTMPPVSSGRMVAQGGSGFVLPGMPGAPRPGASVFRAATGPAVVGSAMVPFGGRAR